jgi:hypothetical protein
MHPGAVSTSLPRLARGLALAAAVLVLPLGCDKGGTTGPEGGGGGTKKDTEGQGIEFTYADQFALDGQIAVDFANDSPEGKGAAKIVAKIRLDAAPAQDKIKLHGKVVELVEYTGSGSLDAEFMKQQMAKAGTENFDLVASLRSSEEWMIVDGHGQLDDEATKALTENKKDEAMGASDFGLFNLPDLPAIGLELGKAQVMPTEEKDESMFGQTIPMEIDRTWTLVSLGDVGGRQVAKLDVTSESSGAAELSGEGGGGMLAIGQESHFVMEFDVEARVPISLDGESMFELSFEGGGQSVSFQNESRIAATYVLVPAG